MSFVMSLAVVALVTWWIIKSDLEKRDRERKLAAYQQTQRAARLADEQACRELERKNAEERAIDRRQQRLQEQANKKEQLKILATEWSAFYTKEASELSFANRAHHAARDAISKLQALADQDGLLNPAEVGRVLNWPYYIDGLSDKVCFLEFRGAFLPDGEVWSTNWPFADVAGDGGYRAAEIIDWIKKERSELISATRNYLKNERSRL
jgi:hypothetical protein